MYVLAKRSKHNHARRGKPWLYLTNTITGYLTTDVSKAQRISRFPHEALQTARYRHDTSFVLLRAA